MPQQADKIKAALGVVEKRPEAEGRLVVGLKLLWYGHGHLVQAWYTVPPAPQNWSVVALGELA